ncbi:MAG: succinyldiaminopimelate transaminase [Campylobacterales bacterium]
MEFYQFQEYPFQRLNRLLNGVEPPAEVFDLTIGEPKFPTPQLIIQRVRESLGLLNRYPKSRGESELIEAQRQFLLDRFGVEVPPEGIIPTFGTREVLFNFPLFLRPKKMAFPNPFYQIYEGAAIVAGAQINYLQMTQENNFKPTPEQLEGDEELIILNSPNNPTGSVLELEELAQWVEKALSIGAVILGDECYSELYTETPPPSLLEASKLVGNGEFKNVVVVNSLSKRNSAPGLRSGFIAGDPELLQKYLQFRSYLGCAIPLPLQWGAVAGWEDFTSPTHFRSIYRENFRLAKEILGVEPPPATFYIWLPVADDLQFAVEAYRRGVKVLPGRFLGRNGAGAGFIRLALVYPPERLETPLRTLKGLLS